MQVVKIISTNIKQETLLGFMFLTFLQFGLKPPTVSPEETDFTHICKWWGESLFVLCVCVSVCLCE